MALAQDMRSKPQDRDAKPPGVASAPQRRPLGAAVLSEAAWIAVARSLRLSSRELEITRGVFDNLTEYAIAADLGISEHTTHIHLNRLFKKVRVSTRSQVVLCVMHELQLLTLSEASDLPPICRQRANGCCPLQD